MVISQTQSKAVSLDSKQTKIAIIGGGFSGVMVAVHLLRNTTFPLNIKLIEPRANLGQGVAYSTQLDCHLLNVPAGKMSAFAEQPNHFLNWLQSREDSNLAVASTFVPRKLYALYLQELLDNAIAFAAAGVSFERITDEAVAIENDFEPATVTLKNGNRLKVDRVVLAIGNFPPANPSVSNSTFYQSDRYISWAWSQQKLAKIPSQQPIVIIGSGLTAIDLVVALHQQGHQGKIQIVSRRGLLPSAHQATVAYPSFLNIDEIPLATRALSRLLRQEIKIARTLGFDWRAVIDAVRPYTQIIWQKLSLTEKRRFLRHLRPYWEIHRHRLAPAIAHTIKTLRESQQLVVYRGRIQAYQEDVKGVNVIISDRHKEKSQSLRAAVVVNCTGSECDYRQLKHPLILNLLASGQIRPDPLHLGLEVASNGALIDCNGNISQHLYTLGSPQKGCLWETTAIAEIREQAKNLAGELLKIEIKA